MDDILTAVEGMRVKRVVFSSQIQKIKAELLLEPEFNAIPLIQSQFLLIDV